MAKNVTKMEDAFRRAAGIPARPAYPMLSAAIQAYAMDAAADPDDEIENYHNEKNKKAAGLLSAKIADALKGFAGRDKVVEMVAELARLAGLPGGDQSEEDEEGREGSPAPWTCRPTSPAEGAPPPAGNSRLARRSTRWRRTRHGGRTTRAAARWSRSTGAPRWARPPRTSRRDGLTPRA